MASILRVNTLTDASSGNSVPMETVAKGSGKSWVNFNGTGTIAARDSLNVGSLTDNGAGDYSVNFSNAFNSANYVFQGASQLDQTGFANNSDWVNVSGSRSSSNPSAASHRVVVGRVTTEAGFDTLYNYMTYHGDLA